MNTQKDALDVALGETVDGTAHTRLLGTVIAKNSEAGGGRLSFLLTEPDARTIRDLLAADLRDGKYADGKTRSLSVAAELTFIEARPNPPPQTDHTP